MKTIKVKLTFTEPLLGTWPANPNVAREYIASKGGEAPSKAKRAELDAIARGL